MRTSAPAPWRMPHGEFDPPRPFDRLDAFWVAPAGDDRFTGAWHVYGALVSLDLAMARSYLPAIAGAIPLETPAVPAIEERHFAQAATLFDPAAATPAAAAAIRDALDTGRARLDGLPADPAAVTAVADDAGLYGLRRNLLAWTLGHRPEALDGLLSRTERFWVGWRAAAGRAGREAPPRGWGAPAIWRDGCLCVRIPPPETLDLFADHAALPAEHLAAGFADLPLAVAEAVDALRLPAAVVGDVLPLALRELLDAASSSRRGRGRALAAWVDRLPQARIEDYVASLVGPGKPLRPAERSPQP